MTLLNRPNNGHVPSMVVLWRTARVFGQLPRARLEALCRPRVKADDSRIPATFATWRALGMIEGDDERVLLAPPFDTIDENDTEALRTAVLDLLMRPENSPALLDTDASEGNSRASDFVRVATWALAQDPYQLASWNQGRALEQASAQGIDLFRGDGRWPSFEEWAYFVGLGVMTRFGLVMSPARAIREALSGEKPRVALSAGNMVPLTIFLEDLANAIPVLDGGPYRVRLDSVLRAKNHAFEAHQVSPTLALALLQLDHEGEIELRDRPGDVATSLSLLGRGRTVVATASHVRRSTPRLSRRIDRHAEGART
ncbi:protein DpdG [Sorangium sp. So ce145]|uniref:protein DpdG n=1 Tax=Sorangium sp. So ce145 TaxID=3133285 RepID=UPI003F60504F